jgi:AraC-like DNA-binding protein
MDPFSDIFSALRITRAVTTRLEASAPWGWRSTGIGESRVNFVLVQSGAGILSMQGHPEPVQLAAGDVFILLDNDPYTLVDHPRSAMVNCTVVEEHRVGDLIRFGGGGAVTTFVSGAFAIDELEAAPVLAVLPRFLHLRLGQERSLAFETALKLLAIELAQPGLASEATIARLYEVLFVYAVRAYLGSGMVPAGGWLAAVSDKQLAPAARAMHEKLQEPWTLDALAAKVFMSRSVFAARFKQVVGQTPLDYLTHWRLHRAKLLLRTTLRPVAQIAYEVGYESESSFSRVFKRTLGVTPGAFRQATRKERPQGQGGAARFEISSASSPLSPPAA